MLMPKRVKHRKQFRGSMAGKATRGNKITYGEYGIVALDPCWIKSNLAVVKPGRVLFEIAGVPEDVAKEALRLATHKLPCRCKIVSRADLEGGESNEK